MFSSSLRRFALSAGAAAAASLGVASSSLSEAALDPSSFRPFRLVQRSPLTPDTSRYVFSLPPGSDSVGVPTASCVVIKGPTGADGKPITKPYTPVEPIKATNTLDFVIKHYSAGADVSVSKFLSELPIGAEVDIKGPFKKFDYVPNQWEAVGMLAGGSGITPMLQVITEILRNPRDRTEIRLIFSNHTPTDIMCKAELDALTAVYPNFKVLYVVSSVPAGSAPFEGFVGHVGSEQIRAFLPPPAAAGSAQHKILISGPPAYVKALAGEKNKMEQGELAGVLKDLRYSASNVFKY